MVSSGGCDVALAVFFFLMLRRSPTSTLFPYTTLFRSFTSTRWAARSRKAWRSAASSTVPRSGRRSSAKTSSAAARSEEHTSELQSPDHLVCRLLLEKKKRANEDNGMSGQTVILTDSSQ